MTPESQSTSAAQGVERPVFVDHLGRRHHLVRLAIAALAALVSLWLGAIVAGLFGFDALPSLNLPGTPSPAKSESHDGGAASAQAGGSKPGQGNAGRAATQSGAGQATGSAGSASSGSSGASGTSGASGSSTGSGSTQTATGGSTTGSSSTTGTAYSPYGQGYGKPSDSPGVGAPTADPSAANRSPDTTRSGHTTGP
jgi:hypothetical protein